LNDWAHLTLQYLLQTNFQEWINQPWSRSKLTGEI
jgi:hypothetical protein